MELGLGNRRALVTGSTAGIGFATARLLAGEGADVIINGRTGERVARAIELIREDFPGAQLTGVSADLGTQRGCAEMVARVPAVDILVNNVGIFEPKPFEEISDEDWLRFFEVNVMSGVRLTRHYLPRMRTRELGPDRLRLERVRRPDPVGDDPLRHDQDRAGGDRAGRRRDGAGTGVTVNSVLPGPTASEGVGGVRRAAGAGARRGLPYDGAGVLHHRAAHFAAPALRPAGRGGRDDRLSSAARTPPRRPARPFGPTAESCGRSSRRPPLRGFVSPVYRDRIPVPRSSAPRRCSNRRVLDAVST